MLTEIREGRGMGPDADYLHLDLTHLPPEQIDAKLPDIADFVRTYQGLEPKHDLIPVQPTAHYAMGGIPTNVDAEVVIDAAGTVVPGLYAAGECACVSVHGANRLGTNSLLDIVVFGRRGGRAMATFVQEVDAPEPPAGAEDQVRGRIEALKAGKGGERVAQVRQELQTGMTELASVFRTDDGLARMTDALGELRHRNEQASIDDKGSVFNYDLTEALELGYLIDLAEALVVSARARTE
ncbi:MAG: FAD-binding protein, partial [Actinomycetota bacterium]|nr:FAD-binding protein [Actinomycetota bacterium]